jgi:hypothetical protein
VAALSMAGLESTSERAAGLARRSRDDQQETRLGMLALIEHLTR